MKRIITTLLAAALFGSVVLAGGAVAQDNAQNQTVGQENIASQHTSIGHSATAVADDKVKTGDATSKIRGDIKASVEQSLSQTNINSQETIRLNEPVDDYSADDKGDGKKDRSAGDHGSSTQDQSVSQSNTASQTVRIGHDATADGGSAVVEGNIDADVSQEISQSNTNIQSSSDDG